MIYVCPLADVPAVLGLSEAKYVVSMLSSDMMSDAPANVDHHLKLAINDIVSEQHALVAPAACHIEALLEFVRNWDRLSPMLIHCWAGISRSPAAAFISLCALRPEMDEMEIARQLRQASPTATPNRRLVSLADTILERDGRMLAAADHIGRGQFTSCGNAFSLSLPANYCT
jgi:predicted protein tyrosine phosphatase